MTLTRPNYLGSPRSRSLFFPVPEDLFTGADETARRHEQEVRSPAIDRAINDWNEAKNQENDEALRAAGKAIVDATSAAFRVQGIPTFAHPVLPPQFVVAEVASIRDLPDDRRSAMVATLLDKFEHSAKRLAMQQFASTLADRRYFEREEAFVPHNSAPFARAQWRQSSPALSPDRSDSRAPSWGSSGFEPSGAVAKPKEAPNERARHQAAENSGRFADYNDGDIAKTVDTVVDSSTWFDRRIGNAGKGVNGKGRYVWTRYGWVDLQHVIGAATVTDDPMLNELLGLGKETEQYLEGMKSGFKREDLLSNAIGASALAYQRMFGGTIGQAIAHVLARYRPLKRQQADEFLRNGGQAEPWP